MNANADVRIPLGEFAPEGCASRNKFFRLAAHARTHLRIHKTIRKLPLARGWLNLIENVIAVSPPDVKGPAIDRILRGTCRLQNHLLADLLIDSGHTDKDVGSNLRENFWQLRDVGAICQHNSA